jgi:molybdenum cofactor guanylyltransferase
MLKSEITGLILAGGRGRRMEGKDKGLILFKGRPLVSYAIDAMKAVCGEMLISANRSFDQYEAMGYPVIKDADSDFRGPLSGVLAGMKAARSEWVLTMPCDMPLVTPDILDSFLKARNQCDSGSLFVGHDGSRFQPLLLLTRCDLAESLDLYLDAGGRRVEDWILSVPNQVVDLSEWGHALMNMNRPEELVIDAPSMESDQEPSFHS